MADKKNPQPRTTNLRAEAEAAIEKRRKEKFVEAMADALFQLEDAEEHLKSSQKDVEKVQEDYDNGVQIHEANRRR